MGLRPSRPVWSLGAGRELDKELYTCAQVPPQQWAASTPSVIFSHVSHTFVWLDLQMFDFAVLDSLHIGEWLVTDVCDAVLDAKYLDELLNLTLGRLRALKHLSFCVDSTISRATNGSTSVAAQRFRTSRQRRGRQAAHDSDARAIVFFSTWSTVSSARRRPSSS